MAQAARERIRNRPQAGCRRFPKRRGDGTSDFGLRRAQSRRELSRAGLPPASPGINPVATEGSCFRTSYRINSLIASRYFQWGHIGIIGESKQDSRRFDKLKALSLPQGQDPETQRSPWIAFYPVPYVPVHRKLSRGEPISILDLTSVSASSAWGLWVLSPGGPGRA